MQLSVDRAYSRLVYKYAKKLNTSTIKAFKVNISSFETFVSFTFDFHFHNYCKFMIKRGLQY
jgi:hypothetical protein